MNYVKERFVLLIDIGSTYTKVVGVDLEKVRIIGAAKAHTTILDNVCIGLNQAILQLETKMLNTCDEELLMEFRKLGWHSKLACSSAAGGLRMVAVGLVESLTSKAAKEASLSAGAKILKTYSGELNSDEINEIKKLEPDILLLSGGTDGGNKKTVIKNFARIGKAEIHIPIIYAGNKSAIPTIELLAQKLLMEVHITDNVMPKLNELSIVGAKEAIAELFIKQIIQAKGISEATSVIDGVLMPTPLAVMEGARLLAQGIESEDGLGDILVIDVGGATTDIHSVCEGIAYENNVFLKGLKEPFVKRSVEGDLGARYSMRHTIENYGEERFCEVMKCTREELNRVISIVEKQPDIVAKEASQLQAMDQELTEFMVTESVRRHAGRLIETYTPMGRCFEQVGKDLRRIHVIIGTGGPVIHSQRPYQVMKAATCNQGDDNLLVPKATEYYLDESYILSSMGLLSGIAPKVALQLLKKQMKKIES